MTLRLVQPETETEAGHVDRGDVSLAPPSRESLLGLGVVLEEEERGLGVVQVIDIGGRIFRVQLDLLPAGYERRSR